MATVLAAMFAPPVDASIVDWAEANFYVPDGPFEGQLYSLDETPYLRPIAEALRDSDPCNIVSVRKSAQTGVSTLALVWIGFTIDCEPTQMLVVQPSTMARTNFIEEKLDPAIRLSPALSGKVADVKSRSREGSTVKRKKFPGGWCALAGAGSPSELRMRTVRRSICDEVGEYEADLAGQGSPIKMVEARHIAYHATGNYKSLRLGTPTLEDECLMDADFLAGSQEYWHVPCPHCGTLQRLEFANLRYNEKWPYDPRIECVSCHEEIREYQKRAMVAHGEPVATHPERMEYHRSFHIDALVSNLTTWDKLVEAWLDAEGSIEAKKTFWNLWLGLAFPIQGDAPDAERLHERALKSDYAQGTIPDGVLFLTAGADVQKDRIEVYIYGWGVLETRYLIAHLVLLGDTNEMAPFIALEEVRRREFTDAQGHTLRIKMMAVDSRYRTQQVYRFAAGKSDVMAIKGGSDGHNAPLLSAPKQAISKGVNGAKTRRITWFSVGTWIGKGAWYSALNLDGPDPDTGEYPPGYVFLPNDIDIDTCKQMTAEVLVHKPQRGGRTVMRWEPKPNQACEGLDCAVYAHVAAYKLGMGTWRLDDWRKMSIDRFGSANQPQLDLLDRLQSPLHTSGPSAAPAAAPATETTTNKRVIKRGSRRV